MANNKVKLINSLNFKPKNIKIIDSELGDIDAKKFLYFENFAKSFLTKNNLVLWEDLQEGLNKNKGVLNCHYDFRWIVIGTQRLVNVLFVYWYDCTELSVVWTFEYFGFCRKSRKISARRFRVVFCLSFVQLI